MCRLEISGALHSTEFVSLTGNNSGATRYNLQIQIKPGNLKTYFFLFLHCNKVTRAQMYGIPQLYRFGMGTRLITFQGNWISNGFCLIPLFANNIENILRIEVIFVKPQTIARFRSETRSFLTKSLKRKSLFRLERWMAVISFDNFWTTNRFFNVSKEKHNL